MLMGGNIVTVGAMEMALCLDGIPVLLAGEKCVMIMIPSSHHLALEVSGLPHMEVEPSLDHCHVGGSPSTIVKNEVG